MRRLPPSPAVIGGFALVLGVVLSAGCSRPAVPSGAPESTRPTAREGRAKVSFNEHIRPILNQNCVACHGGVKSAGEISFVYRDSALRVAKKSGRPVIMPGAPEASELMARITSPDPEYRMPPTEHGPALAPEKIALLRQWIADGAPWEEYWAFVPPKPQPLPPVAQASWARGPIDRFVLARLEREKLAPAPEAPRAALLRRVSLDLTGLPPTPEELAALAADRSSDGYEKHVDRLLASPHFGERWASVWLDLARYADTRGYEKDAERAVWKYREWVVDAFNRNLPYDQFVIEQLAGDLLPGAALEQHIATAFHRQTQVNDEGGTDDEEYRVAAVIDRVATTWAVTNAITLNCAQCHAHPYEPIRQEEFYQFLAFFNTTRDADLINEHPTMRVPDEPAGYEEAWRLQREIERLQREVVAAGAAVAGDAAPWRALPVASAQSLPAGRLEIREGEVHAVGTHPSGVRFEVVLEAPAGMREPLTALRLEGLPLDPEVARHTPEQGFVVSKVEWALEMADGSRRTLEVGRHFPDSENFPVRKVVKPPAPPPSSAAGAESSSAGTVVPPAPAMPAQDLTLDFHFAAMPTLERRRWVVAALVEPLAVPAGAKLRVTVTHSGVIGSKPAVLRRLRLTGSSDPRWTALAGDAEIRRRAERVTAALEELARIRGTDLPVMAELPPGEERETLLFARGDFLRKEGPPLEPGVPALFPPLPVDEPRNRLGMARWFFRPEQPLTARVAVNRFWEQLFGLGLVETLEDFGSVGEKPSHPELLDWLARHFQDELRWDMKALLRELVTSATYRQDARVTADLLARDPRNRLLARGPRQRLTAEMVRDTALAASGLLSRKLHGPPVMPYQPPGVWASPYNSRDWVESKGEDRHRRALYTFLKRSAAYPGFLAFDAPAREMCLARRAPTNTPLQALVTLNDAVYHEAAQALAARVAREAGGEPDERIARAFELVISRRPAPAEAARLRRLYNESRAARLATDDPTAGERAALATVASAILNLDAALIR